MRRPRTATLALRPVALALAALGIRRADLRPRRPFVARAAGATGLVRDVGRVGPAAGHRAAVDDPVARRHSCAAARYTPAVLTGRPLLLVPGVHAAGIDEPRLVSFARELAAIGHPVLTAELTDLTHYRITPRTTDMIEDAALWLAGQPRPGARRARRHDGHQLRRRAVDRRRRRGRRCGIASRSCCRSAATATCRARCDYLCTGIQPDGTHRPPHDYGVAIILLGVAEQVVPAEQVEPLRSAILAFLEGVAARHGRQGAGGG